MEKKQNSNVLAIIVMILLFGMISFVTNLASPMGDILKNQFQVANWMGTLGVLANFIAYAVMGIPAGNMLQKYGYKKTALVAVGVGFAGVGIQTIAGLLTGMTAFGVYLLGAFVAGFSMCMLNIVVNPMLNKLGGGGNKGNQLIQVGGSFNSLMGTACIFLTGVLIPNGIKNAVISDVFPLMYLALGIFALAFVIIALSAIPEPHMETAEEKAARLSGTAKKDPHGPMSFRHFVLGAIAIFFYVGVEVGIPNTANIYMSGLEGVGPAIAGTVVGFYWFCMMLGRLFGGAVGAKVSSKTMLTVSCSLALVFVGCIMFIPETVKMTVPVVNAQVPVSMVFMFLCGLCTSVMFGSIFNLATEGLGKYTPVASGIFMAMICGGGIMPFIQGLVADAAGFINSYWVVVAGLAYMLFYGLFFSKNVNKDIPVE